MFWKRKTDEEFIESQRKWIGMHKWISLAHLLMAIIFAVALTMLLKMIFRLTPEAGGDEFPIGFLVGLFFGIGFVKVGLYAGFALLWLMKPRAIRLLIEYHDRLHEQKRSPSAGDLSKTD